MDLAFTQQLAAHLDRFDPYKIQRGILIATLSFATMGTITAVWLNPFFTRMTPIGEWEFPSLFIFACLVGVFAAIRQPACSTKKAGIGSIGSFLGIACPTCNKLLMLIFGGETLMRWFDPVRPVVTVLGLVLLCLAIRTEMAEEGFRPPQLPRQELIVRWACEETSAFKTGPSRAMLADGWQTAA